MTDPLVIAQVILSGLFLGSTYSLVGVGLTLIWGNMRIVNFAHGSLMMLSMYAAFWAWFFLDVDPLESVLLVFPLMFGLGYLIERVLIKPILEADSISQLLLTFGLMLVIQNLVLYVWRGDYRVIRTAYSGLFWNVGGLVFDAPRVATFLVAISCAVGLHLFLTRTNLGLAIRATSQDREAAQAIGIGVRRVYGITFGLGTAFAGIAGVSITTYLPVYPDAGTPFLFMAFVVVVLGSLGNYLGAMIAGLLMGVVEGATSYFFFSEARQLVAFLVFILILVFKPEGIFGRFLRR